MKFATNLLSLQLAGFNIKLLAKLVTVLILAALFLNDFATNQIAADIFMVRMP